MFFVIRILLFGFIIFLCYSASAQQHNLTGAMSMCRLVKKPKNFNYEGATPCYACKKKADAEEAAKKKEDERLAKTDAAAYKRRMEQKRIREREANMAAAKKQREQAEAGRVIIDAPAQKTKKGSSPISVASRVKYEVVRTIDPFKLPVGGTQLCTIKADGKVLFTTSEYYDVQTTGVPGFFAATLPIYRNGCAGDYKNDKVLLNVKGERVSVAGHESFGLIMGTTEKDLPIGVYDMLKMNLYEARCESYTPDNYIKSKRYGVVYMYDPINGKVVSQKDEDWFPSCPCN